MSQTKSPRELQAEKIAKANDLLRTTMTQSKQNRVVFTAGVAHDPSLREILWAVLAFKDFTPDKDPHGEHDFGKVTINGTDYFFKIDYYDDQFEYGLDPYEEEPVCRVLTIMRADEY